MIALRHARSLGRVAVFALCCLLAADQDADARRSHHARQQRHSPAPEFTGKPNPAGPIRFPDTRSSRSRWTELDGWAADDHAAAFATFLTSCRALIAPAPRRARDTRPIYAALWRGLPQARARRRQLAGDAAQTFFEENFGPSAIAQLGDTDGFLTGYYEPVVEGSRVPTDEFKVAAVRPAARPRDMARRHKGDAFPNTGRVMRRMSRGKIRAVLRPRARSKTARSTARNLEICCLQGSRSISCSSRSRARRACALRTARMLRVNYDSHNGHPYTAVGRILIDRGIIPREEMSMDRIREWMAANPEGGQRAAAAEQVLCVLPHHRPAGRRGGGRRAGCAAHGGRSIAVDKLAARLRHAVFHRGRSADRQRKARRNSAA